MAEQITLETLSKKIDELTRISLLQVKTFYDLEDLVKYTGLSKYRIYDLTSKREIPHYKRGKQLFFKKSEIDSWLTERRIKTNKMIESEAATYCVAHKKQEQ